MALRAFVSMLLLTTSAQGFAISAPTLPSKATFVRPTSQTLFATVNESPVKEQEQALAVSEPLAAVAVSKEDEGQSETQKLMKQVKDAGVAGVISYALWELGFWFVSVPVVLFGYYEVVGKWPDLSNSDDLAKLGAEAFAFVNFARFAVPLRIGLALSTTPWIQNNIVDRFMKNKVDGDQDTMTMDGSPTNSAE